VVAVELHAGRARHLADVFGDRITLVRADAADLRLPTRPFAVVASVPYAVTSSLLRRLTHRGSRLVSAHLIVQAQAAERWASPAAPAANRWQRTFDASVGPIVPRRAFTPPPRANSRMLVLQRR
jgi:23S rRNA (adenine-N6)-dimethyltransferase